jgi:carbon starvation protein
VLVARPVIVAPAFNFDMPAGSPPIAPLLFVTIACGAISGFHGLVGSGTTSKQLDKETDARFVGYIGSSGEGALALMSIVAATAGFASTAEWHGVYHEFGSGGLEAFVTGGSLIVSTGTGLSREFSATLLTVMAVLFAGTTMDAGVRLQRYIVQEWGTIYDIAPLRNGYIATIVAVASCLALAFGAGGAEGTGGMILWPLFGTTNQILGGLTLLVISVILVKMGRPSRYTLVPMVFVTSMAFLSALYQLWHLYRSGNYLLLIVDMPIVLATVWVMLEAASAFARERRERAIAASASAGG